MCRCKNCQAALRPEKPSGARHTDYVWSFVNKIARETRKSHPRRLITCAS